ncbi:MAG: TldD/PmbA family protein [Alphaproteobacteria bacterium]|nr:TldD/PmbA family protein [Alphaproteobacteria bacterium]
MANEADTKPTSLDLLSTLVAKAMKAGASAADAVTSNGVSLSVTQRLGKREDLERAEGTDLGLRVFMGKQQAMVASTETSEQAMDELVSRALSMAKAAPEDPYCGLVDPGQLMTTALPDLDLLDPSEPDGEALYARAAATEDAALAVDGITNSDGAGASWNRSERALVTSDGFAGGYSTSGFGCYASVIAGEGTGMETDYAMTRARHAEDLEDASAVGREAGDRTVARLNPAKVESMSVPVVFEPRVANSMLGHLTMGISGPSVARGTSFLRKDMGKQIFGDGITIIDDPLRQRGLSSRPVDGEGVAPSRMALIDDGILKTWILSAASARQLGLASTGHASRGTSMPPSPSPSNLYMEAGTATPEELMADIDKGIFVNSLIGFGVNPVTGDYSRGASGFLIENGQIAGPIAELTIAGNLKDMFMHITPANDLKFRYGTDAPTIRIDGMTVAGK